MVARKKPFCSIVDKKSKIISRRTMMYESSLLKQKNVWNLIDI